MTPPSPPAPSLPDASSPPLFLPLTREEGRALLEAARAGLVRSPAQPHKFDVKAASRVMERLDTLISRPLEASSKPPENPDEGSISGR
jgi:hypothetical protein